MAQFEPLKDEIESIGTLVFIAAEKRRGIFRPEKFFAEHTMSFPFLLDEDRAVTKAYGVHHRFGMDALNIARPATFVIDLGRTARLAYVGLDQRDRTPIEAVMHVFRGLNRPQTGKYSAEQ